MLELGRIVDRYRVDAAVWEGADADVYRATHRWLGTVHALKIARAEAALLEARVQARLVHPNVVRVTDAFEVDGGWGWAADWVNGPSLAEWLNGRGAVPPTVAVPLFRGVLHGVAHAHRHGVVHRDLKPENILLERGPGGLIPRVADFGGCTVAGDGRWSRGVGGPSGTPEYLAPERLDDPDTGDARVDLFSLGCVLYELLCGRVAFDAPTPAQAYRRVRALDYTPVTVACDDVPAALAELVERLLQADPGRRPQTCDEVLAALGDHG